MKHRNKKPLNTKNKIIITVSAILAVVLITLAVVIPLILQRREEAAFQIPAMDLPQPATYALNQYQYDELDDVQTTVRADAMNVTKRNLPRTAPQLLSDNFALVYNESTKELYPVYDQYTAKANEKVASITFNPDNYPAPYYRKASATTGVYTTAATAAGQSEADYFAYYKYMYMTQGQHLAHEAARRSATTGDNPQKTAEFITWLKKHPSADGQYGAVKGTDNAVEKEIILDPLYRSLHTTGLYLPAGEPVTIKVEGLAAGQSIGITLGSNNTLAWRGSVSNDALAATGQDYRTVNYHNKTSDYFFKQADLVTAYGKFFDYNNSESSPFLQSQWKRQNARAPWTSCDFIFNENKTYTFGFAYGGLIQINMRNAFSQVKVTITGAVETPHYILGVTTPEYFGTYLKDAPGVIAALDTENGILTGPTGELGNSYCNYMRTVSADEIDQLAMLWHSFLTVNETFTGGTYNRHNKVMFDWHVPAGAAVSLGNYSFAMPTGWFGAAMNYRSLLATGTWGTLHEIGHNHGSAYGQIWGFGTPQEGEVRNNALTLLSYILFCDVGTTIRMGGGAEHGAYANPYNTLSETLARKGTITDFANAGYFPALGMYANIMHSFGAKKFYELLYTYKTQPSYIPQGNTVGNKRSDFAYRCSLIYGMNFYSYFNDFYAANLTQAMFSAEQWQQMNALPNYQPISCYYAGGIDGVKTAGDYLVAFGDDITFDLQGKTISTLDQGQQKGFTVVAVDQPQHGTIKANEQGQWTYSFNSNYTGNTDQFSFRVKLSDGVIHTFTIYLRISYHGARINSYDNLNSPASFDNLATQIANQTPQILATATTAGVPTFNAQKLTVHTADFYWEAPVTGEVALMVGGNTVRLYAGDSFTNLQDTGMTFSGSINPNNYLNNNKIKYVMHVEKGHRYPLRVMSYNNGSGNSGGDVYVLTKDNQVLAADHLDDSQFAAFVTDGARWQKLNLSEIYHPNYQSKSTPSAYVFEPSYLISQKDRINLTMVGTDKSAWSVLKAPEVIHGGFVYDTTTGVADETKRGHYGKETQYVLPPEAYNPDGTVKPDYSGDRTEYVRYFDLWNYLIDGETGTNLHTPYSGTGYTPLSATNPHEFIIDTKTVQPMNYFAVTTRANANSYITEYELYLADERAADGTFNWRHIASGDRQDYVGNTITVNFADQNARYLRLVVKKTTGGSFSVLSEIDAGIKAETQKLISTASSKLFTKGWVSSSTIPTEPSGYLIANRRDARAVIRFRGDSIALYAATAPNYGSFTIKIDGKQMATINLDTEQHALRKLVYHINLEDKEHTMEIITNNAGTVKLSAISIPYMADLLNAPNIYFEKALIIALTVFIILFVAVTAFLLCLLFIPKFRHVMGNNRFIAALDRHMEAGKLKRQTKRQTKKLRTQKPTTAATKPTPTPSRPTITSNQTTTSTRPTTPVKPTTTYSRPTATPTRPTTPIRPTTTYTKPTTPTRPNTPSKPTTPSRPH